MLTPHWYQQEAIDSIFSFFEKNRTAKKHPILVCPTASGKSLIQAETIRVIMEQWPSQKIMCLAHVSELIEQNYLELKGQAPHINSGIYSAGLKRKELYNSVTFAGIQSIWDKAIHVGHIDLVFIDEAHLCPNKSIGRYRKFLDDLKKINPNLRIIGLSATPWRLNGGSLTVGAERLFTDVAYEIPIETLIDEGYLCKVGTCDHKNYGNLSNLEVSKSTGDFTAATLSEAVEQMDVVHPAVTDAIELAKGRNSIMFFCSSIDHAENVCTVLEDLGETFSVITGKTPKKKRKQIVEDFKNFKTRCLVSVSALTTGFNAKNADAMVCLRPTASSALWVQMVGRIMRTHGSKADGLLLDYGGNIERHGAINTIKPPAPPKPKKVDTQTKVKLCPECKEEIPFNVLEKLRLDRFVKCPSCDHPIEMIDRKPNHNVVAAKGEVRAKTASGTIINSVPVDKISFRKHVKAGSKNSVRVEYQCGLVTYKQWLCIEHGGVAEMKAKRWFVNSGMGAPDNVEQALRMNPKTPKELIVDLSGQYPRILDVRW